MILYHGSPAIVPSPDVVHSRTRVDFGKGFNNGSTSSFPADATKTEASTTSLWEAWLRHHRALFGRAYRQAGGAWPLAIRGAQPQACIRNQAVIDECLRYLGSEPQ